MKKNICLFICFLFVSLGSFGQEVELRNEIKEQKDGLGIGFKLSEVKDDFGLGLEVSSPTFLYNSVSVRMNALWYFREHFSVEDEESIWSPYFVGRLGLVGIGGKPVNFIRLYGEGGVVFGFGNDAFTSEDQFIGGYGLFGFEFFMSDHVDEMVSYYVELGGTGAGGQADKLPGKVIYHNGFTIGTGFRFYF